MSRCAGMEWLFGEILVSLCTTSWVSVRSLSYVPESSGHMSKATEEE